MVTSSGDPVIMASTVSIVIRLNYLLIYHAESKQKSKPNFPIKTYSSYMFEEEINTLSREDTLSELICLSCRKGIFSKRKALAPSGSKCFPFRVDSFAEGA